MKLTAEQKKVFEDWVRQKMEHHSCHLCQSNRWKIGELVVIGSTDVMDDLAVSAPNMVQLICQNCGHVLLFDVRVVREWNKHDLSHSGIIM